MPQTGAKDLNQIGKVLKSNGADGDVLVDFASIELQDLDLTEPVYVVFDGVPVPFFILSLVEKGSSRAVLRFVDVDSAEDAEELVGKPVLSASFSFEDDGEDASLASLAGWTVRDGGKELGAVSAIEEIPGNPCLYVAKPDGTECIVPFHEDLVVSADPDARTIVMSLPEGLV